jgi:arylsulfatase A-like enzyme
MVRWPGTIPPAQVSQQAAITMDWTATILAVTGTAPDPAYPIDGDDLMPVCTGQRGVYDRSLFWRTVKQDAARIGNWKYLQDKGQERLFDVSLDPGEKNDLRVRHPDVFDRMKTQYLAWNARMLPRPKA